MDKIVKNIIVVVYLPFLLLHLICYYIYYEKVKEDICSLVAYRRLPYQGLWAFLFLLVFEKPFRNLFYHRLGRVSYFFMRWILPQFHPYFISKITKVGSGLIGEHPFSTILNADSIGQNFLVRNNVTIGVTEKGRPIIGDNVTVNVNCVIIGGITVGDNVIIGAGSVVTKNVPSNCVVVGNPARIIRQNGERVNLPL